MGWTLQNALHMFGLADLQSGSDMFTAINIPAGQSVEDQDTELVRVTHPLLCALDLRFSMASQTCGFVQSPPT